MDENKTKLSRSVRWSWMLVAGGILLLLVGLAVRILTPGSLLNTKWVEGFGIFFTGWGAISLARYLLAAQDPVALKRLENEEQDERVQDIRRRAGNAAFLFTILITSFSLLIYSAATSGEPVPDLLWWFLAFLVIAPGLVYILSLVKYNREL